MVPLGGAQPGGAGGGPRAPSSAAARTGSVVAAVVLLLVGTGLVVVGSFLPWVVSGSSERNSFATVRSADRLGLVDGAIALAALRAWYLVPLGASLVPLLVTLHRVRAAAVTGVLLAGVTGAVAVVVVVGAPHSGVGPVVSATGGLVVCVAATAVLVLDHRSRPT